MSELNKVATYSGWTTSTNAAIERIMDDAALASAHPDDTLVIVGPARLPSTLDLSTFAVVGMVQSLSINQSKPFQPMMAIGSSRSFYLGGKAQGSFQCGRLFMNTDNLLKRLYTNNIKTDTTSTPLGNSAGVDPATLDTQNPAGAAGSPNYLINLDSEFFLIPFGMGVIFRNKARAMIGGFYMELCVLPNFTVSVQAGQSMIMEGVTGLFDRIFPLPLDSVKVPGGFLGDVESADGKKLINTAGLAAPTTA